MRPSVGELGYPQMDLMEVKEEGRYIKFLEHAFEWHNMSYVFYPYFWSKKKEWPALIQLDDRDPIFEKFLRAGAARVQVPVRQGYENMVDSFLASGAGTFFGGADTPIIDDELYLSIADEMKEQLGNDFVVGEGTIQVNQGSKNIVGSGTNFTNNDIDKEIKIEGVIYQISDVSNSTNIELTERYRGQNDQNIRYSLGGKIIGQPWEVKLPTNLVMLQENSELPDWIIEN